MSQAGRAFQFSTEGAEVDSAPSLVAQSIKACLGSGADARSQIFQVTSSRSSATLPSMPRQARARPRRLVGGEASGTEPALLLCRP
jgi:hypothetical protein